MNVSFIFDKIANCLSVTDDNETVSDEPYVTHTPPWQLSEHFADLDEIHCSHLLEKMTSMEAEKTLIDWNKGLRMGGAILMDVYDANFFAKMWLEAEWNNKTLRDGSSKARQSFRAFHGDQSKGDPNLGSYDTSYSYIHKSSYNEQRLKLVLERAGFSHLEFKNKEPGIISVVAQKRVVPIERQVGSKIDDIREDHVGRYEFASGFVNENDRVLDFACGVGYGAKLVASKSQPQMVKACDIDAPALDYAAENYGDSRIEYLQMDALKAQLPSDFFDVAISFETIEHLEDPNPFLTTLFGSIRIGGKLICSSPNSDVLPFSKSQFPYHFRHYTKDEFINMLTEHGFSVSDSNVYCQKNANTSEITPGTDGQFLILVAEKIGFSV